MADRRAITESQDGHEMPLRSAPCSTKNFEQGDRGSRKCVPTETDSAKCFCNRDHEVVRRLGLVMALLIDWF